MTQEVVIAHSTTVSCEGNAPGTGHPKVYLTFSKGKKEVVCPYCSRTFKLSDDAKSGGH